MNRHGTATVTLPSDREILVTRVFDASPAKVFRAWTEPEYVRRWWARPDAPLVVCEIDLRVDGSWRYVTRRADGVELGWHGTYQQIQAPNRIVSTEVFEGYPDAESENTLTLDADGDMTVMRVRVLHSTRANRDGHVDSGMESGLQRSLDAVEDILAEMPDTGQAGPTSADRYRKVAGAFTERVRNVPDGAWDNPAPCDGWVARDIVRHLVEWVPALLADGGVPVDISGPSVEDDPLGAWLALSDAVQAILDDSVASAQTFVHPRAGSHRLENALGMFVQGDVLIHTWDLARATGQDETLDAEEVAGMYAGMLPIDEMLRHSGQYGPRVDVPDNADTQTKLIAFVGRQP